MAKLQNEMNSDSALKSNSKSMTHDTHETISIITELNDNDVLCGKERTCVNHQGSRKFRAYIDEHAPQYVEAITKQEKMAVTKALYDRIGAANGRFLKYNVKAKGWVELSSLLARDKISHALRFANRDTKSTSSVATPSKKKGHRRNGSETSTGSESTYTTVATHMSFDESEDVNMDDEPLNWMSEEGEEMAKTERPYVYEIPFESTPPPSGPYYHPSYGHPYYYHPSYGYPYHYGHYPYYYHRHPEATSSASYSPATTPTPATVQREESTGCLSFPDKPDPEAPVRKSSMDVDLSFLVNEPLIEWDMQTDEVFICE